MNEFLGRNGPQLAAAIAFYALFSLFPLALALVSVLGYIAGPTVEETWIVRQIGEIVPISKELVIATLEGVVRARTITGIAAIVGLFWAANAVFGAIRKGINATWGIRQPRPFFQERFIDFTLSVGAAVLVFLSITTTAILSVVRGLSETILPELLTESNLVWSLIAGVIPFLFTFVTFTLLYWLLPNTQVRLLHVIPGALLGSLGFETVKNVFIHWVRNYDNFNILYGPIGGVLALMTWLYVSAFILLLCAAVTSDYSIYQEERSSRKRWRQMFPHAKSQSVIALPRADGELFGRGRGRR